MKTPNSKTVGEEIKPDGHRREILMPDDYEPIPHVEAVDTEVESKQVLQDAVGASELNEQEQSESALENTCSNTQEWTSFMSELKSYDPTKRSRDERLVCRIDRDICETIDDIEILGCSRPDIVSAIVRTFFKRHLSRLMELRRVKKSMFPPINNVCQ